jgi:hypothetical protein
VEDDLPAEILIAPSIASRDAGDLSATSSLEGLIADFVPVSTLAARRLCAGRSGRVVLAVKNFHTILLLYPEYLIVHELLQALGKLALLAGACANETRSKKRTDDDYGQDACELPGAALESTPALLNQPAPANPKTVSAPAITGRRNKETPTERAGVLALPERKTRALSNRQFNQASVAGWPRPSRGGRNSRQVRSSL